MPKALNALLCQNRVRSFRGHTCVGTSCTAFLPPYFAGSDCQAIPSYLMGCESGGSFLAVIFDSENSKPTEQEALGFGEQLTQTMTHAAPLPTLTLFDRTRSQITVHWAYNSLTRSGSAGSCAPMMFIAWHHFQLEPFFGIGWNPVCLEPCMSRLVTGTHRTLRRCWDVDPEELLAKEAR